MSDWSEFDVHQMPSDQISLEREERYNRTVLRLVVPDGLKWPAWRRAVLGFGVKCLKVAKRGDIDLEFARELRGLPGWLYEGDEK